MPPCLRAGCHRKSYVRGLCWAHAHGREPLHRRSPGARTAAVTVNLTPEEKAAALAAAGRAGMALAAWIGELIEDTLALEDQDL